MNKQKGLLLVLAIALFIFSALPVFAQTNYDYTLGPTFALGVCDNCEPGNLPAIQWLLLLILFIGIVLIVIGVILKLVYRGHLKRFDTENKNIDDNSQKQMERNKLMKRIRTSSIILLGGTILIVIVVIAWLIIIYIINYTD